MDERIPEARAPLSYRLAVGAAAAVPLGVLPWAASVAGFVQYWVAADRRRAYLANASKALRAGARCPPWRAFQAHALNLLEVLRVAGPRGAGFMDRMTLLGAEHIDRALTGGRGLVLATFHSGNWELAGLMLAEKGYPITTVAGEQLRPGWSDQVKALKGRRGIRVAGPGAAIRSVYRDARSNRVIVLHIDGDLFEGGCEVSFLGRTVVAPRGPAHLGRALGCPVAFAYCRRMADNRLEVHVEPAADPPIDTEGEMTLTQALMARVEKSVLEDPGQWCIFRRLASGSE